MTSQAPHEENIYMGNRIAQLRDDRGLTQKQLADKAGISGTFLSEVENGKRNISMGKLLAIADALDTTTDYLARGTHSESRPRMADKFPPELSNAAEENGWSYSDVKTLLQVRELVLERRTPTGAEVPKNYAKLDWIELHKRLFE
jgi:transcriptional regulator with XRE-family HTH domain